MSGVKSKKLIKNDQVPLVWNGARLKKKMTQSGKMIINFKYLKRNLFLLFLFLVLI